MLAFGARHRPEGKQSLAQPPRMRRSTFSRVEQAHEDGGVAHEREAIVTERGAVRFVLAFGHAMTNGRVAVALMITGVALVAFASACAKQNAGPQGPGGIPVKVQVAEESSVDDASEFVATLKSRESAVIMPQVEGQITEIFVRAGDRVTAETPLMQIDPAKQQATVKTQEDVLSSKRAGLAWAKQQYERVSGLATQGISSQSDLDQAKAALDAAQADLQAAEAQVREQQVELHYYNVKAPRDGVVGDIPVRVGDRVTVSTVLTTVDRPGSLEAYISVPVERGPQLRLGMPVQHPRLGRRGRGRQPRQLRLAAGRRPDADDPGEGPHREPEGRAPAVAVHPRPGRVGHAQGAAGARCSRCRAWAARASRSWPRARTAAWSRASARSRSARSSATTTSSSTASSRASA